MERTQLLWMILEQEFANQIVWSDFSIAARNFCLAALRAMFYWKGYEILPQMESKSDDWLLENMGAEKILLTMMDPSYISSPALVDKMIAVGKLLRSFNSASVNVGKEIDENARDPSYFIAAYLDTKNLGIALFVYRLVKALTEQVLLYDRFYENGEKRYRRAAEKMRGAVTILALSKYGGECLIRSINVGLGKFSEFWALEKKTKNLMLQNHEFSYAEIRNYLLAKSSDASLVYARVLKFVIPSFNENVGLVLHYNQALLDIYDDLEDIGEDLRSDMPNIFVMATLVDTPYDIVKRNWDNSSEKSMAARIGSTKNTLSRLVDNFDSSTREVLIPEKFLFLKVLSRRYADGLRMRIAASDFQ